MLSEIRLGSSLLGPGAPSYLAAELATGRSVVSAGPDSLGRFVVADPSIAPLLPHRVHVKLSLLPSRGLSTRPGPAESDRLPLISSLGGGWLLLPRLERQADTGFVYRRRVE